MKRLFAYMLATVFAAMTAMPVSGLAQDQKKEQVHKGTPAQGTVQKQEHKKDRKKDGSGKTKAAEKK